MVPSEKSGRRPEIPQSNPYGAAPQPARGRIEMEQMQNESEIIKEKDEAIQELKETIEIMEMKIKKLEQLVKLKDGKIQTLANKLAQNEENLN